MTDPVCITVVSVCVFVSLCVCQFVCLSVVVHVSTGVPVCQ